MKTVSTFAMRLTELMEKKGLTKTDLAKLSGVNKSNITRYLRGDYKAKQDVVYQIAQRLGVDPAWLMGYDIPMGGEPQKAAPLELAPEEGHLVRLWRRADEIDQKSVMTILSRYEEAEDPSPPVRLIRHYLVPAAAGYASPIEGEDYEELPLPEEAPRDADFCIDIQGDSMEPYIPDGSRVYVKRGAPLAPFDVGVFFVDGDVFCKQWAPGYAGENYLLSANPQREDANITIFRDSGRNCVYFGKVLLGRKLPQPVYR